MLTCFNQFRPDHWGEVVFQHTDPTKNIEKYLQNANDCLQQAEKAKQQGNEREYQKQVAKAQSETAKARVEFASQSEQGKITGEIMTRLNEKLNQLNQRVNPTSQNQSERPSETSQGPTIDEFQKTFQTNFARKFPDAELQNEPARKFAQDLGPVIGALDVLKRALEKSPQTEKEIQDALQAYRGELAKFNTKYREGGLALPNITETDNTVMLDQVKVILAEPVFVRAKNIVFNQLSEAGKKLKENIAKLKEKDREFLIALNRYAQTDTTGQGTYEVSTLTPAFGEMNQVILDISAGLATERDKENGDRTHEKEVFAYWTERTRTWQDGQNRGGKATEWSLKAANIYRSAVYSAFIQGQYTLSRPGTDQAFTAITPVAGHEAAPADPSLESIKQFLVKEKVLREGNQTGFTRDEDVMSSYLAQSGIEASAGEKKRIETVQERYVLPREPHLLTKEALRHPLGAVLGTPWGIIALIGLIWALPKGSRWKAWAVIGTLLGVETIGGFGALADGGKVLYDQIAPYLKDSGEWGKKLLKMIFGEGAGESVSEAHKALLEWFQSKKAGDFADKTVNGIKTALDNDIKQAKTAGRTIDAQLEKVTNTDIGKFIGLKWVYDWLHGDPNKPFSRAAAEAEADEKKREADAAAQRAREAAASQPPAKPLETSGQKQEKLNTLAFDATTSITWSPAKATTDGNEAVRKLEYTDASRKHEFEIRYDGNFFKAQKKLGGTAANLEFFLWYKPDGFSKDFPHTLSLFNFTGGTWNNATITSFISSANQPPTEVRRVTDTAPYYANEAFHLIHQRTDTNTFVDLSMHEKATQPGGTLNPYTIVNVSDNQGTPIHGAQSRTFDTRGKAEAAMKTLDAPAESQTESGKFYGTILPSDKFTNITFKDVLNNGQTWLEAEFTYDNQKYHTIRELSDPRDGFWVEAIDANGKHADGSYSLYMSKTMFTEYFTHTIGLAQESGYTNLWPLSIEVLEKLPANAWTDAKFTDLENDVKGNAGWFNLFVNIRGTWIRLSSEKGAAGFRFKANYVDADKMSSLDRYNNNPVKLASSELADAWFNNVEELKMALKLPSGAGGGDPKKENNPPPEQIQHKDKVLERLRLQSNSEAFDLYTKKFSFAFDDNDPSKDLVVTHTIAGETLSITSDHKINIGGLVSNQACIIDTTPFLLLDFMVEVRSKKANVTRNETFDDTGSGTGIEQGSDLFNSNSKRYFPGEDTNLIDDLADRLLINWWYGGTTMGKIEFLGRYKNIGTFYTKNEGALRQIVPKIVGSYTSNNIGGLAENYESAFYINNGKICLAESNGMDDTLEECLGNQYESSMKGINYDDVAQENRQHYLMLALNKMWCTIVQNG